MEERHQDIAGYRLKQISSELIFFAGFGEWTKENVENFCQEVLELSENIAGREWALLGDVSALILEKPEVQELVRICTQKMIAAGCTSVAFYTGPGALKRLSFYRLMEPDSPGFRFRVYLSRQRAMSSLRVQGYDIQPEDIKSFFRGEDS